MIGDSDMPVMSARQSHVYDYIALQGEYGATMRQIANGVGLRVTPYLREIVAELVSWGAVEKLRHRDVYGPMPVDVFYAFGHLQALPGIDDNAGEALHNAQGEAQEGIDDDLPF